MQDAEPDAAELHQKITSVFARRSAAAAQSQYDRSVCIRAVGAAREVFEGVSIEGSATEYCQTVLAALGPLLENYNDPDGEFTSGRGVLGDIYSDIYSLLSA